MKVLMKLVNMLKRYVLLVVLVLAGGVAAWAYFFNNGLLGSFKLESDTHFAVRLGREIFNRTMVGSELTLHVNELVTGTQTRAQLRGQFAAWKASRIAQNLPY